MVAVSARNHEFETRLAVRLGFHRRTMSESLSPTQNTSLPVAAPETAAPVAPAPAATLSSAPGKAARFSLGWPSIVALAILSVGAVAGGVTYGLYSSWNGSGQIARGVRVQGEDLSGLSKAAAQQKLAKKFGYMSLDVEAAEHSYRVPLHSLGGNPQITRVVNYAYWVGRSGSLTTKISRALFDHETTSLTLPIKWDKAAMRHTMSILAKKYNRRGHDARLKFQDGALQVVGETQGRALNVGATCKALQTKYRPGLSHLQAVTMSVAPRVTAAALAGTDTKLGEYRTTFDSDLTGRTRNVHIAAAAVDGSVLMPGETFSFNSKTGERTWDKGYRMAHIFQRQPGEAKSQVVDGLAGGVCQVSSTLFNAVRKANNANGRQIEIVQRESHSLPVTYVPSGLDATVAWPDRDFKFRNKFKFPVYVRTEVEGSHITISIWGRVPATSSVASSTGFSDTTKQKL